MTLLLVFIALVCVILFVDFIFYMFSFNVNKVLHPARYRNVFLSETQILDRATVDRGRNRAQQASLVIATLCRDVAPAFDLSKRRLESIGQMFGDYHIVIFENDSSDNSRQLLQDWATENPKVTLLDCCDDCDTCCTCRLKHKNGYDMGAVSFSRVAMMRDHRNRYMEHVAKNLPSFDYLMVYDFDLEGALLKSGLFHTLGLDGWNGMFANGRILLPPLGLNHSMYDSFAFRAADDEEGSSTNLKRFWQLKKMAQKLTDPVIPVRSAFNGLGLYKMPEVLAHRYRLLPPPYQCEHIGFHADMHFLYINPAMFLISGMQGPNNKFKAFVDMSK